MQQAVFQNNLGPPPQQYQNWAAAAGPPGQPQTMTPEEYQNLVSFQQQRFNQMQGAP